MTALGESLRVFWLGMADHLWQTSLVLLVLSVLARVLRNGPARLLDGLWLFRNRLLPGGLKLWCTLNPARPATLPRPKTREHLVQTNVGDAHDERRALEIALLEKGILTLPRLIGALSTNPARILGIPAGSLRVGHAADITVLDLDSTWTIDVERFHSKSRNCPFHGWEVKGRAAYTLVNGKVVYSLE